ncbi:MAG TPA: hypothetical protein DD473_09750 [Planctomycetaceae bacterium]|nr:hypothetical protein [Planctomycetaceae bacterium]|tara:strand:- start:290 stop:478 length:189 start_codon:yes stop_codon:yes gene_type:complete
MSARHKLNAAYLHGSLIIAGIVGGISQSYLVFGFTFAVLLIGNIQCGDIRLNRHQTRRPRRK